MRTHNLKCWPEPFQAIIDGAKRHEVRQDDRGFAVGDTLVLDEWHPGSGTLWRDGSPEARTIDPNYSGRRLRARITYKSDGGTWGLPVGLCVLSIEVLP